MKKYVAIKKIRSESDEEEGITPSALREISVLKRLNHPNIVTLLDTLICPIKNEVYLVFDFYE